MGEFPPGSDLLQLDLWDGTEVMGYDVRSLPWSGRSPRGLTRVALGLILKPRGEKSVSDFVDPDQCVLRLTGRRVPREYRGAPLLLPLKRS